MKKLNIFLFVLGMVFLSLVLHFAPKAAATGSHNEWGEWKYSEYGECVAKNECGAEGYQSREKTRTCVKTHGHGQDECQVAHCPDGYSMHNNTCRKWDLWNWEWKYKSVIPAEVQLDYEYQDCELKEYQSCETETTFCLDGENITVLPSEAPEGATRGGCFIVTPDPKGQPEPAGFSCPNADIDAAPTNYHIARRPTEIDVRWFWPALGDSANIYLRPLGGEWESSHNDVAKTGDYQEVTLYLLDPTVSYEVGLEIKNGCGGGAIAVITDPVVEVETIFASPFWELW